MTVIAKYYDVPVAIRHETWYDHVAVRHPEVMPYLDHVISTIEEPEIIGRDVRHPERVYFYRRWPEITDFPSNWIEVMVLIPVGAETARFLSAWAARETGGKEIIWTAAGPI